MTKSAEKPWYKSKTLWFNAIVAGLITLEANLSALSDFIPGNVYAYLTVTLAIGNSILRIISAQTLLLRKKK